MIRASSCSFHILEKLFLLLITSAPVIGYRSTIPLRINSLHIPSPVVTGESVMLSCDYELGNETLYAIKWYKNMGEFFRYVPLSIPPFKMLPQPGVRVDINRSTKNTVYLESLELDSFGNYTCQVSTDNPHFRCVQTTRALEVVVPPSDGPILMDNKSNYEMGDNVSILCSSGKSKPAAELKWYINDHLVNTVNISDQETMIHPDNLESSSLVLQFNLKREFFRNGKVVLKCVASIYQLEAAATKEIRANGMTLVEPIPFFAWIVSALLLLHQS